MNLRILMFPADKRIVGIACAFFTTFAILQTAGALLAPQPAGNTVFVPFVAYCAEIFLALALGIAFVVNLVAPASLHRGSLAGALWAVWLVMAACAFVSIPRLATLLDRYEYGASLGTISAAPGMTVGEIARHSSRGAISRDPRDGYRFAPPPGRIFTFAIDGTPTAFDHASLFDGSADTYGTVRSIHAAIAPGTLDENASAAAFDRAKASLVADGWKAQAGEGVFTRGSLRLHIVRKIVGHASIDDPNSAAIYAVDVDVTGR